MAMTEMMRWAMGACLLEHCRNVILEESMVERSEPMFTRRWEWFGHMKRRDETENIRGVAKRRKTQFRMEGHYQKEHEYLEDQGRMGHRRGKIETYYSTQGDGGERWCLPTSCERSTYTSLIIGRYLLWGIAMQLCHRIMQTYQF